MNKNEIYYDYIELLLDNYRNKAIINTKIYINNQIKIGGNI